MQTNYATTCCTATPSAYITVNKSRVKQFNDTVYLKDGDHFQLELYNPKQTKVLAKVILNGISISNSGLVIKPGQRVFLDRFIDSPDKFKFETYSVNGSNEEVQKAIQNNGSVEVQFFDETPYINYNCLTINAGTGSGGYYGLNTTTCYTGSYLSTNGAILTSNGFNASNNAATFTSSASLNDTSSVKSVFKKEVETGRIEKGTKSDQSFGTDYSDYNCFYVTNIKWKILPLSVKPVDPVSDIKEYCTSCGYRNRGHNYCPKCGSKF